MVDTENAQVGADVTPLRESVELALNQVVGRYGADWEAVAAYALSQAAPGGDKRTEKIREADLPYTYGDWELGRAVRDLDEFVTRFRATAERPDTTRACVTSGNPLAIGGVLRVRMADGFELAIDHDGDGIEFMALPGDPSPDVRLGDHQVYLRAKKGRNEGWLDEDDDWSDEYPD